MFQIERPPNAFTHSFPFPKRLLESDYSFVLRDKKQKENAQISHSQDCEILENTSARVTQT